MVQEQDFLAGIAFVVFIDRIDQCQRRTGPITLGHIAIALIDRALELRQRFLRAAFIVEAVKLERIVAGPFFLIRGFSEHLETFQLILTDWRKCAGQGIDESDFDVLCKCERRGKRGRN